MLNLIEQSLDKAGLDGREYSELIFVYWITVHLSRRKPN